MKKLIRRKLQPFLKSLFFPALKKVKSTFRYNGMKITIYPGVFHPKFFYSTKILLEQLKKMNVAGKSFLEIGAGNGVNSFQAAKLGAKVTAIEISKTAVLGLYQNNKKLGTNITIVESDLFQNLAPQVFDIIFVNPPYFNEDPTDEMEKAWYCGKNFEFFHAFFAGLQAYTQQTTEIIMILSEDCKIDAIRQIANQYNWHLNMIEEVKRATEKNYLYSLQCNNRS